MQSQYSRLLYHIIWSTKIRVALIDSGLKSALYKYLRGKVLELGGGAAVIGGTANHVHLVASIPPRINISTVVGRLKGASSHWINHIYRPGGDFAWQGGYGAFTLTDDILASACAYVENQEEHHRRGTIIDKFEDDVNH